MDKQKRKLHVLPLALAALLLALAAPMVWAGGDDDDDEEEIPFSVASIFFELNNTDGDLGIHALIDGEAWKKLEIESPDEKEQLEIKIKSKLRRQGLTELFFESAEPTFDELDPADFFKRFKSGYWEVEGETIDGEERESEVFLSHVLAAAPGNIMVGPEEASEDCDEDVPSVSAPVTISWDPVTGSHPEFGETGPITVVKYQLVVEREEPSKLVMSIDLPPSVTEFEIPEGFTDLGEEFKFEILVREETGNQTAVESCFELE